MATYEELKSDKALVCRNARVTDLGPGFIYYVCLADGYLIECGCDPDAEKRAEKVARAINLLPVGERP